MVCSTFLRSGKSVVTSASLAKGCISKKEIFTAPPQGESMDSANGLCTSKEMYMRENRYCQ